MAQVPMKSVARASDLVVTEFDVNDKNVTGDFAARDGPSRRSAALSRPHAELPRLRYVMAWGIVDKYSCCSTPRRVRTALPSVPVRMTTISGRSCCARPWPTSSAPRPFAPP